MQSPLVVSVCRHVNFKGACCCRNEHGFRAMSEHGVGATSMVFIARSPNPSNNNGHHLRSNPVLLITRAKLHAPCDPCSGSQLPADPAPASMSEPRLVRLLTAAVAVVVTAAAVAVVVVVAAGGRFTTRVARAPPASSPGKQWQHGQTASSMCQHKCLCQCLCQCRT